MKNLNPVTRTKLIIASVVLILTGLTAPGAYEAASTVTEALAGSMLLIALGVIVYHVIFIVNHFKPIAKLATKSNSLKLRGHFGLIGAAVIWFIVCSVQLEALSYYADGVSAMFWNAAYVFGGANIGLFIAKKAKERKLTLAQ